MNHIEIQLWKLSLRLAVHSPLNMEIFVDSEAENENERERNARTTRRLVCHAWEIADFSFPSNAREFFD